MSENKMICRICLTFVNIEVPTELNSLNLQILKIVSPQTNVNEIDPKAVLCETCSDCLQKSFEYKTTCLNNEDYLNSYLSDNNIEIIPNVILPKDTLIKSEVKQENALMCRLCFSNFGSEQFTDLSRIEDDLFLKDMIEKCLSEINLDRNGFMCDGCMHSLQNQFNLVSTLLDTNDKIKDFISHDKIGGNNREVNLHKVLQFVQNIQAENKNEHSPIKVKEEIKLEVVVDEDHAIKEELLKEEDQNWDHASKQHILDKKILEKNDSGLYECLYCPHVTTTRDNLWSHLRTHEDTVQLKCEKCDFTTKWPSSLYQHSWLHEERMLYYCDFCPYKSRYKKHVKRHSIRHDSSGELPLYRCKECSFSTKSSSYFGQHNKQRHGKAVNVEVAKSFSCEHCNYVTQRKCMLTRHCKVKHKTVMCEYCGFRAGSLWHLKNHSLKHKKKAEVTMYRCAKCDFQTKYKNSLKNHLYKHCPLKAKVEKEKTV